MSSLKPEGDTIDYYQRKCKKQRARISKLEELLAGKSERINLLEKKLLLTERQLKRIEGQLRVAVEALEHFAKSTNWTLYGPYNPSNSYFEGTTHAKQTLETIRNMGGEGE